MIINDRRFLRYIGCCSAYFLITILYLFHTSDVTFWQTAWFSDKFFVFQYAIIFLLGCSLISQYFNCLTYSRYGTRKQVVLNQLILYVLLDIVLVTLLFSFAIIATVVFGGANNISILYELLNSYFRFILGSYLLGCLSMILEYSGKKILNSGAQIITFLLLAVEVLFFVPQIHQIASNNINLLFSWIFFDGMLGYCFLLGLSTVLTFLLFIISRRSDLSV